MRYLLVRTRTEDSSIRSIRRRQLHQQAGTRKGRAPRPAFPLGRALQPHLPPELFATGGPRTSILAHSCRRVHQWMCADGWHPMALIFCPSFSNSQGLKQVPSGHWCWAEWKRMLHESPQNRLPTPLPVRGHCRHKQDDGKKRPDAVGHRGTGMKRSCPAKKTKANPAGAPDIRFAGTYGKGAIGRIGDRGDVLVVFANQT